MGSLVREARRSLPQDRAGTLLPGTPTASRPLILRVTRAESRRSGPPVGRATIARTEEGALRIGGDGPRRRWAGSSRPVGSSSGGTFGAAAGGRPPRGWGSSGRVREDAPGWLGLPADRVRTVPLGVSKRFTRRSTADTERFLAERG